jgi:hypothetical protein
VSPINYAALSGQATAADHPPDGHRQARLDRAALVDTQNGERLVTEWSDATNGGLAWTSWNRFDTSGLQYTRELLAGLGIDTARLTDDDVLIASLNAVTGRTYDVRTASQQGSQGDRWFTSTYVDGHALGVQEELDAPIDTRDLPDVPAVEDEKIPF